MPVLHWEWQYVATVPLLLSVSVLPLHVVRLQLKYTRDQSEVHKVKCKQAERFEVRCLSFRVLDAFGHQKAIWSDQVTCSPPGPNEGPYMTELLLGGGVPRIHEASSPAPPRLPLFPNPQTVCYFATRLQALTHYVAPLMDGQLGCKRCQAHATRLTAVGPLWRGVEAV